MKASYLQSASGNNSSTRLMFVFGLLWSMAFTTIGAFSLNWGSGECIAVFTATSSVFVALKLVQKPMEKREVKPENIQS
jgi:hypothetical protein